jgi:hypothetical protein
MRRGSENEPAVNCTTIRDAAAPVFLNDWKRPKDFKQGSKRHLLALEPRVQDFLSEVEP